jgi:hypothetical protein
MVNVSLTSAYRILNDERSADSSNKHITTRTLIPAQIILVNSIVSSSAMRERIDQSPRAVADKRHTKTRSRIRRSFHDVIQQIPSVNVFQHKIDVLWIIPHLYEAIDVFLNETKGSAVVVMNAKDLHDPTIQEWRLLAGTVVVFWDCWQTCVL